MPYPDNIDNHFVVDSLNFDFYAMDCYRHVGDDRLASTLADEVIRGATDFNGFERAPMRIAEARITLGVAAAREGDREGPCRSVKERCQVKDDRAIPGDGVSRLGGSAQ